MASRKKSGRSNTRRSDNRSREVSGKPKGIQAKGSPGEMLTFLGTPSKATPPQDSSPLWGDEGLSDADDTPSPYVRGGQLEDEGMLDKGTNIINKGTNFDKASWFSSALDGSLDSILMAGIDAPVLATHHAWAENLVPALLDFFGLSRLMSKLQDTYKKLIADSAWDQPPFVLYGDWYEGQHLSPERFNSLSETSRLALCKRLGPEILQSVAYHHFYLQTASHFIKGACADFNQNGLCSFQSLPHEAQMLSNGLKKELESFESFKIEWRGNKERKFFATYQEPAPDVRDYARRGLPPTPGALLFEKEVQDGIASKVVDLESKILGEIAVQLQKNITHSKILNIIAYKQWEPSERVELNISRPTHFGRGTHIEWATERMAPPEFGHLDLDVRIDNSQVSRNHCAVLPIEEGESGQSRVSGFSVLDLRSLNGTNVHRHGRGILPAVTPVMLQEGDRISIGGYWMEVKGFQDDTTNNFLLMIGHSGGNLQGVKNNLDDLTVEFARRGLADNSYRLYDDDATVKNTLAQLDAISGRATADSHTLIYYSGHGSKSGLALGRDSLGPADLYTKIRNIRGKKALIVDCCHAGIFAHPSIVPANTAVLAASRPDEVAYEAPGQSLTGHKMGLLSRAFRDYMRSTNDSFNLLSVQNGIEPQLKPQGFSFKCQTPMFAGACYTIFSVNPDPRGDIE